MALPELVKRAVEKKLSDYCMKKAPAHVTDRFKVGFRIRGNHVTLFESRPFYADPSRWVDVDVAQFRFDPGTARWTLCWRDRNRRWHFYEEIDPSRIFECVLKEVDDDPTGIFWG